MRVRRYLITVLTGAVLAAPAGAQSVKKVTSKADHELQEAGKGIQHGAKKVAHKAKYDLKKSKKVAHRELTKVEKGAKHAIKPDKS